MGKKTTELNIIITANNAAMKKELDALEARAKALGKTFESINSNTNAAANAANSATTNATRTTNAYTGAVNTATGATKKLTDAEKERQRLASAKPQDAHIRAFYAEIERLEEARTRKEKEETAKRLQNSFSEQAKKGAGGVRINLGGISPTVGQTFLSGGGGLAGVVAGGLVAGAVGSTAAFITEQGREAIKLAGDFEQAMAQMQAITKASAETMAAAGQGTRRRP
jgi:hypothetical protein